MLTRGRGPHIFFLPEKSHKKSQDIEDSLDEFFTNRLTLRLMISHIQALNANKNVNSDGEARWKSIHPRGNITEDGYNYGYIMIYNHKIYRI